MKIQCAILAVLSLVVFTCASTNSVVEAAQLKVGTATVDITPSASVPLWGQFEYRPSQGVESPITANALAISAYDGDKFVDSAILVSLDVIMIPTQFAATVREKVAAQDASIDPNKIVLIAIHTHTAPTLAPIAKLPTDGSVEPYEKTIDEMTTKIASAIIEAWNKQVPADFSWGLDPVVLGESRRPVYMDGTCRMWSNTASPDFSHFENPFDPDMNSLFFWDKEGKLLAIFVNVSCTAQTVEHLSQISSDIWGVARKLLQERFGDDVVILGTNGASGDVVPFQLYRRAPLERMRELRGESRLEEAARKVVQTVEQTYEAVVDDKQSDVAFGHQFETVDLEKRLVSKEEYETSLKELEKIKGEMKETGRSEAETAFMGIGWHGYTVERYEDQQKNGVGTFPSFIHVLRIGDVAIATNQFELFTAYGMRIKARSRAMNTIVVEIADGDCCYLPTAEAERDGGYSAIAQSCYVSSTGGQQLVDETLKLIDELWR